MPSSVIHGMVYSPDRQTLDIVFRGNRGTYRYYEVSPEEWLLFKRAPSKGTYLNATFKARHPRFVPLPRTGHDVSAGPTESRTKKPVDRPDENVWGFYDTPLRRGLGCEELAAFCFRVGVAYPVNDRDRGQEGKNPERGGHGIPTLEERAEDDEDDPFRPLHKADFALPDQCFRSRTGVADHETCGHDKGDQADIEIAVAASIEHEQAKEERHVGVTIQDRVKERAEDGDLVCLAGDATIHHVKETRANDDKPGVKEHPDIVVCTAIAEEERGHHVDDESDEGERIRRNT